MPALHALFLLKNQQAFQRLLDASKQSLSSAQPGGPNNAPPLSSSAGRSWTRPSPLSTMSGSQAAHSVCDVNERDWLGRTALHLAVSSPDPYAVEFVRLLLAHPRIDVNLADKESRWTALHRALYEGNVAASVLLLQRTDIDTSLKDFEGYTAFDLYNSTVEGTKPDARDALDLLTWGSNRNACLGLGDGDDRNYAEQVVITAQNPPSESSSKRSLADRFDPIRVHQIAMSKLHSTLVTSETRANVRVCGFGSGGRLGFGQHTQYSFIPVPQLQNRLTAVASGQDHTLALTDNGDVLSWGMNRFSQLGYVIEAATSGASSGRSYASGDDLIQLIPRRIYGVLKKETVTGIAACRTASACWTETELFTWGTNNGQLGYDKTSQGAQVLPRKVAAVTQVLDIALTDSAMACLLKTRDIICFWNGRHFKINFPTQIFPSEIQTYRPPVALNNASIAKVACHDGSGTFAALSVHGEMFTFQLDAPGDTTSYEKQPIKPQRIWALRKQFSAVKDMALGADGSIILCTESGHVFVRSRNAKAGQSSNAKTFKFHRIPYLQRVVRVAANSTGAFGALRADCRPAPVAVIGNSLSQDFANLRPFVTEKSSGKHSVSSAPATPSRVDEEDADGEAEDYAIADDVESLRALIKCIGDRGALQGHDFEPVKGGLSNRGADVVIEVGTSQFPAHSVILAARSRVLYEVLTGKPLKDGKISLICGALSSQSTMKIQPPHFSGCAGKPFRRLLLTGSHPLTVLILLHYIYTDALICPWDRRIEKPLSEEMAVLKISGQMIKQQLLLLSKAFDLKNLTSAVDWHSRRIPTMSLDADMSTLLQNTQEKFSSSVIVPTDNLAPDVILQLHDKTFYCHSAILRARSAFFAGIFDDEDWTVNRRKANGTVEINLRHMKWNVFKYIIQYIYSGGGEEMFNILEFAANIDNVLDFMFEVIAVASELLLDRVTLICSSVILRHITILNVCSVLADATYYHANELVTSLQGYMARNLETLLESRMLDELPNHLVKQLGVYVRLKQAEKYPSSRSREFMKELLIKHADWLALQDFPLPIVPNLSKAVHRGSPKISPIASAKKSTKQVMTVVSPSATLPIGLSQQADARMQPFGVVAPPQLSDDIFQMDEIEKEVIPPLSLPSAGISASSKSSDNRPWKLPVNHSHAKSDFRSIIAEAESSKTKLVPSSASGVFPVNRSASSGQGMPTNIAASQSSATRSAIELGKVRSANVHSSEDAQGRAPTTWRRFPSSPVSFNAHSASDPSREVPLQNSTPSALSRMLKDSPVGAASSSLTGSAPRLPPQTPPKADVKGKATMGPTFTPTKPLIPLAPAVSRRASDQSNVWATISSTPPPSAPISVTPPTSPPSFLAIQQQQRDQGAAPVKAKKSLRDIQQEEQARQQEEEFMRWWAAEEERMKAESALAAAVGQESREDADKKGKRSRRKPPFKGNMLNSSTTTPVAMKDATTSQVSGKRSTDAESRATKGRRSKGRPSSTQGHVHHA